MAFFPRQFYSSNASIAPILRIFDDFDSCSRQSTCQVPQWQPKFDIRETEQGYELHGELAGVNKEHVNIKFAEPQTLTISGKSERSYTSGTTPAALDEDTKVDDAATESSDTASSHQATVEDDYETVESEDVAKETQHPDPEEVTPEEPVQQKRPVDNAKYWLTERSVGEFSRSFKFASRIEHESITATFKDGVLSVIVPKAKQHESRRIIVN